MDKIPLTPVGKIFKPALRWDAIKRVYEEELRQLGDLVESVEVKVSEDKIHGSLATITVKPATNVSKNRIADAVNEILGRYTVKYRLEIV